MSFIPLPPSRIRAHTAFKPAICAVSKMENLKKRIPPVKHRIMDSAAILWMMVKMITAN